MKINNFLNHRWIFFVSQRFSRIDRNGRSAVTSALATLGICFGIMTLIVITSVMNGFQMEFKDAIMELSSYHVQASGFIDEAMEQEFINFCKNKKNIVSATPFYEAQSFIVSERGKQAAAVIRAVPHDVCETDAGFAKELHILQGSFNIEDDDAIVLGSSLAHMLGVHTGTVITLLALSGGSDVALLSESRQFRVAGVFYSGYADINMTYAFINSASGQKNFGESAQKIYGIKLRRESFDAPLVNEMKCFFPKLKVESWRSYNRSFFGVLQVEKNMLLILVLLIFVVVAINMYNGMRRLVFERRGEIATLSALGGKSEDIKAIFILRGFLTGCIGGFGGVLLGLFLSVNIATVFAGASRFMYYAHFFVVMLVSPENAMYIQENPMYMLYAAIPARIFPLEVFFIALFGICSPLAASYAASRDVLKMTIAEVLHDE